MSVAPRYDAGVAARDAWPAILSVTDPEVRTRIRIAHTRTQRDGWGYETTVEVEYAGLDDEDALARLQGLMQMAGRIGEVERDMRNTTDEQRAVTS